MNKAERKQLIAIQQEEITGYHIYSALVRKIKDRHNAELLREIAQNELDHYHILKKYTNREVSPRRFRVRLFLFLTWLLGLTFTLKLMEHLEKDADNLYEGTSATVTEVAQILEEEDRHEKDLLNLIDEERLDYMSSIVLGLNDALVELTGALAGFTFAIQKSRTIALMGLITGIAATFSMAASEFLSQRQGGGTEKALKSSFYTGMAYIGTVIFLILPFFLLENPFLNLALMMTTAAIIILLFNYYIATAKGEPFWRRFWEMFLISLGVAVLSFGIGYLVRTVWGLEV